MTRQPLRQSDAEYHPRSRRVTVPYIPINPEKAAWNPVEYAIAEEAGERITHPRNGDIRKQNIKLGPDHPLNPFSTFDCNHFPYVEIRSAVVRDNNEQRGRFKLRREQHEQFMQNAKHLPDEHHDTYLLGVYENLTVNEWRLHGVVELTAPELDELRDTWTWTETPNYEVATITWSKIPGLDPLLIESDEDGYWTLDSE